MSEDVASLTDRVPRLSVLNVSDGDKVVGSGRQLVLGSIGALDGRERGAAGRTGRGSVEL